MMNSAMFKEALKIVALDEDKALSRISDNSHAPSNSFYTKCDEKALEIINKQQVSLPTKKVLTILIAATLIISLLAVVTYATRDKMGGFFYEFFNKYVKLTPEENLENRIDSSKVSISYLPNGFEETRRKLSIAGGLYEWKSGDSVIKLMFNIVTKGSYAIDTEDSNYVIIEIDGIQLHKRERLGQTTVTWTDEKIVYTLSTYGLEWDEMVKIIEGIKIGE